MSRQSIPDEVPDFLPEMVSAELVRAAQAGNEQAREQLFATLWPISMRVARRMTSTDEDAGDVVQDAFVKALLNIHRFDFRSTFRTWLLRIVTNTATDHLRRTKRKNRLFQILTWSADDDHSSNEPGIDDDPSTALCQKDLRQEIDSALATLSHTTRGAFVLYAEAGMSYQEVSETLGVPIGTVMSRIHAARKKLQVALENLDRPDSSAHKEPVSQTNNVATNLQQNLNDLHLVVLAGIKPASLRGCI